MLDPIITSYKLTTCQLLYLTNTYKPREILLTIVSLYGSLNREALNPRADDWNVMPLI